MVKEHFDVVIAGAGPAGLMAGLLVARTGLEVAIIDPILAKHPTQGGRQDARTIALMQGAVRLLDHLDVWPLLEETSASLWRMRLIDQTQRFFRAPTVTFDAHELGDLPFARNVPLSLLTQTLQQAGENMKNLTMIGKPVKHVKTGPKVATLEIDGYAKSITTPCIVAADGRNSLCRDAADIKTTQWAYPQKAIACSFSHSLPHGDISTEFHRPSGPLTLVPLKGNKSSLVWSEKPENADEIFKLDDESFCKKLEELTGSALGDISNPTPRGIFPIHGLTAREFAKNRVLLVGEAGHVLPPIGAQGLNLGMRDAALVAELIEDAHVAGDDIGSDDIMATYDRRRRRDIFPRTVIVDMLNRSLLHNFTPLQGARGLGLFMLNQFGALRRQVMQRGIQPLNDVPRLMQD